MLTLGVTGVVACGSTGETPTLSLDEFTRTVSIVIDQAAGRIPVMVGTGANDTATAIQRTQLARELGASAVLVVMPWYNKPTQEGLFQHIRHIAAQTALPIVLYNVPGRTGADLANETVARLAAHPNIVGIKDATGDMSRVAWMRANIGGQFDLISGDDSSYLGYHACGGAGLISVASNVAPEAMVALHNAAQAGDYAAARDWQDRLIGLCKALFLDNSPAPTKYALAKLGLCEEEARLPLSPTSDAVKPLIDRAMADAGVG